MTKVTPVIAAPCLIWIALLEKDRSLVQLFLASGLFVVDALPLSIRKRRRHITVRLPDRSNFQNRPVA
jgi:hypothetical protein